MQRMSFGLLVTCCLAVAVFLSGKVFAQEGCIAKLGSNPTVSAILACMSVLEAELVKAKSRALQEGMFVLSARACPAGSFEDVTGNLHGRYFTADREVQGVLSLVDSDGSHEHRGGAHEHHVTGTTARLGGGERRGNEDRNAAHMDNRVPVTGTAKRNEAEKDSAHQHVGGPHEHRRAGFRLCRVR